MASPDSNRINQILELYQDRLVRYAHCLVGNLEQAQDVVQDVFLRLLSQNRVQLEDHLSQWLFTVCRNRAIDYLRKEKSMVTNDQEALATRADNLGDPGTGLEQTERVATLGRRLAELPPRQQEVLRLKFQEEMSYRAIAELTGMTVNNVGVTLHTAMRKLRDQLPKGGQL